MCSLRGRIAYATPEFRWNDKTYRLRADWPDGTAIHGLVKDQPFRIMDRSPVSIRLIHDYTAQRADAWPWTFSCDVRYELGAPRPAYTPSPHQHGRGPVRIHARRRRVPPFFPRGEADEPVAIHYRCVGRYPAEAMIPVAPPHVDDVTAQLAAAQSLGTRALDDVFLGGADGAEIHWRTRRVRFRCSTNLGHAVIYTGNPDSAGRMPAFCFEPVTMVNDGFNLHARGCEDTGVCALASGQSLQVTWDLEVCD
jgi:aldose 1-epimerase